MNFVILFSFEFQINTYAARVDDYPSAFNWDKGINYEGILFLTISPSVTSIPLTL